MSKYNKEISKEFCDAIKALKGRVGACKEVGIVYDTFLDWLKKHSEFAEAIKKAEAECRESGRNVAIQSIFKAMPNQWQAGAWWLERNYPEEFVIKQKIEHSGEIDGKQTVEHTISDKALKALGDAIAGAKAENRK